MRNAMALIVAGAFGLSLVGCNTMEGAGKDVARGGEKIQDASIKVRNDWRSARDSNERDYDTARTARMAGNDAQREACGDKARADYSARMNQARTTYHRTEMRSESEQDRMEDAYEAAREKCGALRGADEDRCVADARAKYRR